MDDATWAALTLTLTLLGAIYTWVALRRRGIASGLRGAAFTLLPLAAYLTKTLQLFTRIVDAVADWATSLVFNPFVWVGVVLAGVSAVLFAISGFLRARQLGAAPVERKRRVRSSGKESRPLSPSAGRGAPAIDDDLAEIEALLRKRGID